MDTLILVGSFLLAFAALAALAGIIRVVLVKIANRNGYTAEEMPMIYHMVGFGIYFSILFVVLAIGAYT